MATVYSLRRQPATGVGAPASELTIAPLSSEIKALAASGDLANAYNPLFITPKLFTTRDIQRCIDVIRTVGANGSGVVVLAPGADYTATPNGVMPVLKTPGTGYTTASVTVSAPNEPGGRQAVFGVRVTDNQVKSVYVIDAGSGYTTAPTVTITGDGTGATAEARTVALSLEITRVGLRGNCNRIDASALTSGAFMHIYGRTSAPWSDGRGWTMPFEGFEVRGPGFDPDVSVNNAQTNPTDGAIIGQSLGAVSVNHSVAGSATNFAIRGVVMSGFRDCWVLGDASYLVRWYDCYATRFWRSGIYAEAGADAGENYTWFGGAFTNGRTTRTSVLRVYVTNPGSGYTSAPTVTIAPPPGAGTTATAVAYVNPLASVGRVLVIEVLDGGTGYDPLNPPAVTISGGGGSGATAVAECLACCVVMPPQGNADIYFPGGTSFDYCDSFFAVYGGVLTVSHCHLEDNGPYPMGVVRQAVAESVGFKLRGGVVSATKKSGDVSKGRKLFVVDTTAGGGQVSWDCDSRVNAGDRAVLLTVTNPSVRPSRASIHGADVVASGLDAIYLGDSFNRVTNSGFTDGLQGWDTPALPNTTVAVGTGDGADGTNSCVITGTGSGVSAGSSYVWEQQVDVAPGDRIVFEVYTQVVSRDATSTARFYAVFRDRNGKELAALNFIPPSALQSVNATPVRNVQGQMTPPPGTATVAMRLHMTTFVGVLKVSKPYIAVF